MDFTFCGNSVNVATVIIRLLEAHGLFNLLPYRPIPLRPWRWLWPMQSLLLLTNKLFLWLSWFLIWKLQDPFFDWNVKNYHADDHHHDNHLHSCSCSRSRGSPNKVHGCYIHKDEWGPGCECSFAFHYKCHNGKCQVHNSNIFSPSLWCLEPNKIFLPQGIFPKKSVHTDEVDITLATMMIISPAPKKSSLGTCWIPQQN